MDKERLEEIKNVRWENLRTSQILHVKWLIEQVQELENLKDAFDDLDSDYIDLHQENSRYRDTLEELKFQLENVDAGGDIDYLLRIVNQGLKESE